MLAQANVDVEQGAGPQLRDRDGIPPAAALRVAQNKVWKRK
jgi:hypothetical protein